jgi:hypothetical protein
MEIRGRGSLYHHTQLETLSDTPGKELLFTGLANSKTPFGLNMTAWTGFHNLMFDIPTMNRESFDIHSCVRAGVDTLNSCS